jgi:flagella basal body P-ring formation protein FlgA
MKLLFKYWMVLFVFVTVSPAFAAPAKPVTVKEQKIKDVVTRYILKYTENLDMEVNITHIGYEGDMKIPQGETRYEVITPNQWEGWGRTNLALIIRVNEQVVKNISIPVEVTALTDMVVAVRPLERGMVIGAEDVTMQKRDIASAPGRVCRSLSEVIGKRVRIAMRGNLPVRSDFLEKVPLVKYGHLVTIIAENDVMKITASGKAMNSGAEGDTVMVRNLGSNKDIPARVVGIDTVKVDF